MSSFLLRTTWIIWISLGISLPRTFFSPEPIHTVSLFLSYLCCSQAPSTYLGTASLELKWRTSVWQLWQLLLHGCILPPAAECEQPCKSIWKSFLEIFSSHSSWEIIGFRKLVLKGEEGSTYLRGRQICYLPLHFSPT
jgi:hypothetical protein